MTYPIKKVPDESNQELEKQFVWTLDRFCPKCGDRMFFFPTIRKDLCRSWLYMEGGCQENTETLPCSICGKSCWFTSLYPNDPCNGALLTDKAHVVHYCTKHGHPKDFISI